MRQVRSSKTLALIGIVAAFAVIIVAKTGVLGLSAVDGAASTSGKRGATPSGVSAAPVADYDAALADGRPIFLNFGLSYCANCEEMGMTVDRVMPDYADEVTYIKVMTDEPEGQELARQFSFRFVPTSYFIGSSGTVVDSYTGKLDDARVRAYLDRLLATE